MPRHKNRLISTHTLKPCLFRSPHKNKSIPISTVKWRSIPQINQVNFHQHSKTKSFSTPIKKSSQPWSAHEKTCQFRRPNQKPSQSILDTKTKLISIQTRKPSIFRPPRKTQVNSDRPHKNQVNFEAHTKTKRFRSSILKPSQFRSLHRNQVKFDPHTEIKSISTTHTKPYWYSIPHTKI